MSSIIGMVEIQPQNILVVDDYESIFRDTVVNVREVNGELTAEEEDIDIKNNIWDGQSLIDPQLMGEYCQYGFILLRNRFFKSAAFNFRIRDFFRENGITRVDELNGFTRATIIDEVLLITTPSSIKYLKFGELDCWLDNIGTMFGVVKHEKPTHFFNGRMVQTHYQLLNTLQMTQEEVASFAKPSLDYLALLKSNPAVLRYHIKFNCDDSENAPAKSKNDVVYKMLGVTDRFVETKLFYDFHRDVIDAYVRNMKCGHILVEGNYSTMCGNPIEMALYAIGQFDGQSSLGCGYIHSTRFADGEQLIGSRAPHVCMGNVWLPTNTHNPMISRYMGVTDGIVVVNSIGENLLSRLSGCDFDADSVLLTNNPLLISAAQKNYEVFGVPTGSVNAAKRPRNYTAADLADLDIKTSVNKIGEIVNLSQELNTMLWDAVNKGASREAVHALYCDVALLDVLSNIEIDRAKREYAIDSVQEISRIRRRYQVVATDGRKVTPHFMGHVARQKGYYDSAKKEYKHHRTTMDYLQKCVNKSRRAGKRKGAFLPFSELVDSAARGAKVDHDAVQHLIGVVRDMSLSISEVWASNDTLLTASEKHALTSDIRQDCIDYIDRVRLSKGTMRYLLVSIEHPDNKDIGRMLFFSLFGAPNKSFYELINSVAEPFGALVEDDAGGIIIHNIRFIENKIREYLQKIDELTIN